MGSNLVREEINHQNLKFMTAELLESGDSLYGKS